ncbi:MAG TPA: hypothetical protein DDZ80_17125 [Cyanobacteria bacterium UBA8803]|nr:hypothetical protein [Cyanobacteria bacterium UBA9273]HBL60120.1 hypothetical protein [Cyanobacteria bacterium UBA8803]
MTETSETINSIKKAIEQKLLADRADEYSSLPQEWELTELRYDANAQFYYALVEIHSSEPGARSALYKVDASYLDWGTEAAEELVHVGTSEIDFPDGTVTIPL